MSVQWDWGPVVGGWTGESRLHQIRPIGVVRSELRVLSEAPRQGNEGAPDAWIELEPELLEAADGLRPGDDIYLFTWLHRADRGVLTTHPRNDPAAPLTGVFATRSPDRPNPIGLHRVRILELSGTGLRVGPLEAIDGTPVIDIKPVLRWTTPG